MTRTYAPGALVQIVRDHWLKESKLAVVLQAVGDRLLVSVLGIGEFTTHASWVEPFAMAEVDAVSDRRRRERTEWPNPEGVEVA